MRLRIAVVATALAVVSVLEAQSVDPALTEAIAGRDKASIARDPAAVGKYTADDYFAVNPNGVLNTKQQRVAGLKVPSNPTAKPQLPLRTEAVTMYGAGAAVARMKQVDNRQLAVWIKNPSGWQMTAIHVIPDAFIAAPPPQERPKAAQASNVPAQSGLSGDRAAVFAAFKQIQDAFFSGDRATYDKLTAPEHVRMNPGLVRFAGEASTIIDGPRLQQKYGSVSVQVWNQLGIVRWQETNAAGQLQWLTRVFAKKATGWLQVATASSLAGNPPVAP